ncbi:MAG: hypothetical protein AAGU11_08455 [Syntrophobacteraceae bacterium]
MPYKTRGRLRQGGAPSELALKRCGDLVEIVLAQLNSGSRPIRGGENIDEFSIGRRKTGE